MPDLLEQELRALGRRLDLPPAPDAARMVSEVRRRIAGPGVSKLGTRVSGSADTPGRWAAGRWLRYAAAAVVLGFAVLVAASSQVRAAIVEFLRFGGVVVEQGSGNPTPGTGQPPQLRTTDLAAARALVSFPVAVPAELGPPDEVTVVDGRVVSFEYRAAGIRLDQFDGTLDYAFVKQTPDLRDVRWIDVGGSTGLWLPRPHEIVYVDRTGQRHTESARLAANTLVWQRGNVTLRLEGTFSRERAVTVAESMR